MPLADCVLVRFGSFSCVLMLRSADVYSSLAPTASPGAPGTPKDGAVTEMAPGDLSASPARYYTDGAALQEACNRAPRAVFEQQHAHLWLVLELRPNAQVEPSFATPYVTKGAGAPDEAALLRRIGLSPAKFGFFALKKAGKNPWKDRILIGRATNNDVVLRDGAVSKVHARAVPRDGGWVLADADSTNGTWVDGKRLTGAVPAGPLRSQMVLKFGRVSCTLLSSGELHAALTGGR